MEEKKLEKLKENYKSFQEKYSLPNFDDLNKDFQIEKIVENETDFILKEIKKIIVGKFFDYLRFTESLINPTNSPIFIFAFVKTLGNEERKKLLNIYQKISKIQIDLIEMDLNYSEEKEANAIKKYFDLWQEIKKEISEIVDFIKKNIDNKQEDNGKYYFG